MGVGDVHKIITFFWAGKDKGGNIKGAPDGLGRKPGVGTACAMPVARA